MGVTRGPGGSRDSRAHRGGVVLPRRIALTLQGRSEMRQRCLQITCWLEGFKRKSADRKKRAKNSVKGPAGGGGSHSKYVSAMKEET
jgi:hypothetical protein